MKTPERSPLLETLKSRFEIHMRRHPGLSWARVLARLEGNTAALRALQALEATGGEPDAIGQDETSGEVLFCDCSAESPTGRRSLCFDREALDSRRENKPPGNAVDTAAVIGIRLLDEAQYLALQQLGDYDTKTSSWVATPEKLRSQGGALFCDRRYGRVFTYHNGAQSYYASRGFRGLLRA